MTQTWMNEVLLQLCLHLAFVLLKPAAPPFEYNYSNKARVIVNWLDWCKDKTYNVDKHLM